jgi:hypothetical protein
MKARFSLSGRFALVVALDLAAAVGACAVAAALG